MRGQDLPGLLRGLFSVAVLPAQRIPVICIDGPTASGKGTVAAEVAKRLGTTFSIRGHVPHHGLAALQAGLVIDAAHETAIAHLASSCQCALTVAVSGWGPKT
jgi:3-phosphoshikimate 1-carboxyvinyltransferase